MGISVGAVLGGAFRRDRLTGQVSVGLVGVLVVAAVVYGVGVASAKYDLADVGAWLSARAKGVIVHVNGPAGKVDGKAPLDSSMRGHRVKVVQTGTTILIIDLETGVVSRLDPSQLTIDATRPLGAGIQVLADSGRAYTVDSVKGFVQQIDPVTLKPLGGSGRLDPVLGQAGVAARGSLWVPVAKHGNVAPFQNGRVGEPVPVGEPGNDLTLTIAGGEPVVIDSTAATATVVQSSGARLTVALPSSVQKAGRGGVLAPASVHGKVVPMLVPGTGSLVTLDIDTGRYSSARLKMPDHQYRPPQILGTKVYIPDVTSGTLIVYDSADGRFEKPIPVGGGKSPLEVFVKDGLLWANDPDGPRAVVIDRQGRQKPVDKYDPKVPGGKKRREIPEPGTGDAPPARPRTSRGPSGAPSSAPPSITLPGGTGTGGDNTGQLVSASNLTVTPGAGTIRVSFQPSPSTNVIGYELRGVPTGATVAPSRIATNAGAYTFTVTGGDCAREYRFQIATLYKGGDGTTKELLSLQSDPVRPCVTPGAPSNVTAKATTSGAALSWAAPAGGGATSYKVAWEGPVTGSKTVTGTSVTLGDVWTNGAYTFTVTSLNEAAAGSSTTVEASLVGPEVQYPVERNENSTAYINNEPSVDTENPVETMYDNNGEKVTVLCQVKGTHYKHPNPDATDLSGDLYTKMTYQGTTGYIIGYLVNTPGDWKTFSGLPVWKCGGAGTFYPTN